MKEYYSRLFLKDGSSLEEVKKAYRKLVKKFHPDKNQESNEYTEEFKIIQEAYEKLVNYLQPSTESSNFKNPSENAGTEKNKKKNNSNINDVNLFDKNKNSKIHVIGNTLTNSNSIEEKIVVISFLLLVLIGAFYAGINGLIEYFNK